MDEGVDSSVDYKALYLAVVNSAAEAEERHERQLSLLNMLDQCCVHSFAGSVGDASWSVRETASGWQLQTTGKPLGGCVKKYESRQEAVRALHKMCRSVST